MTREPEEGQCVLCSLVDGLDGAVPGTSFGHAVEIPDFGRIFLGELLVCPGSVQFSLIRAELGCAVHGHVNAGDGKWQRPHGSAIVLVPYWRLIGCHSSVSPDPATIFQNIRTDFLHGNLDVAQQKAEKARKDFSAGSADWAMKFRLLEAEILTYQGRRPEVIALLNSPGVSYPAVGDIAIKRDLLCGLAHAKLGQAQQADMELEEARRLSDASNSQLNGEVLRTAAVVQIYRGHLAEAADLSRKSLKVAREQQDSFLEATDLLNLGLVAIKMEHYDEALSLLNEAANFARPIQARPVIEAALGNVGSAYFNLGDFEKALSNFQQAEAEAKEIGTTSAQVDWLWAAGSSYYMLGDLKEAAECYQESLKGRTGHQCS